MNYSPLLMMLLILSVWFFAGRKRATSLHRAALRQRLAADIMSAWRETTQGALSWPGSILGLLSTPHGPAIPGHEGGGGTWPCFLSLC